MSKLQDKIGILGWSQAELGRRIGVSKNSIGKWSSGKVKTPEVVILYLDALIDIKGISDRLCK